MSKATNAGVHGSTGTEFQKYCALYILFNQYATLQNRKYFICLEHHDDLLFCYQTQADLLLSIDAFQAKKSSSPWTMGDKLTDIFKQITQTGIDLGLDTHPKDPSYSHSLNFITNNSVALHCGNSRKKNRKSVLINESNTEVKYQDLDAEIRDNIINELRNCGINETERLDELNKMALVYIDLPKKASGQKDILNGQFRRIFRDKVSDPEAAIDTLLYLFRNVENTLNNGNVAKLMDKSKRVESDEIDKAIKVITSKSKAYDFWRKEEDNLSQKLKIGIFDKDRFSLQFQNSFDLFKDLTQVEHQKLYNYVINNRPRWSHHVNETDCIDDIYKSFNSDVSSNLSEIDKKAAICAAYVELKGMP